MNRGFATDFTSKVLSACFNILVHVGNKKGRPSDSRRSTFNSIMVLLEFLKAKFSCVVTVTGNSIIEFLDRFMSSYNSAGGNDRKELVRGGFSVLSRIIAPIFCRVKDAIKRDICSDLVLFPYKASSYICMLNELMDSVSDTFYLAVGLMNRNECGDTDSMCEKIGKTYFRLYSVVKLVFLFPSTVVPDLYTVLNAIVSSIEFMGRILVFSSARHVLVGSIVSNPSSVFGILMKRYASAEITEFVSNKLVDSYGAPNAVSKLRYAAGTTVTSAEDFPSETHKWISDVIRNIEKKFS